jgi:division protein CdvB (Snf7/Vps24/ESCRT-III family)
MRYFIARYKMQDTRYKMQDARYKMQDARCRMQDANLIFTKPQYFYLIHNS